MKKMFNLAVAIVAMCSAVSLTSCDKFFGNSNGDQTGDGATIVEPLDTDTADTANVKETPEAAAPEAAAPEADKADEKAATDKAPAAEGKAPAADKASDTPAEKK